MQETLNSAQKTTQLLVRINGTLPNISILDQQKSERAAEIKRNKVFTNANENFHLLVDVDEGVVESLEKGRIDITYYMEWS